ncbi:hypothetical protein VCHA53O466_140045 [Vibrio chagasii]|nr:hypothetical protein VCHA53O466_140045 [Vibrio chagasii]
MSKLTTTGTFRDLKGMGLTWRNARRGSPTTEIESNRPFKLIFQDSEDPQKTSESYAIHTNSNGVTNWFVSFFEHSDDDSEIGFTCQFLQEEYQRPTPLWTKEGKAIFEKMLMPFVNDDGYTFGAVTGITKGTSNDDVVLRPEQVQDLPTGAQIDIMHEYCCEKLGYECIAVEICNEIGDKHFLLLNLETMMITTKDELTPISKESSVKPLQDDAIPF